MKKSFFKFLFLIAFVFCGMSVFADNWYVCLGSFRNKKYAQERLEAFADTEIPVFISETVTKNGSLLYRVLYCKPYVDIKDAKLELLELRNNPTIKNLGITDLWCCKTDGNSNVKTVYVEKTVEVIKEVPVEVVKTVEVIKEVPVEVVKTVEVIKEVPVESKKDLSKETEFDNSLDEKSVTAETEDEKELTEKEENPPKTEEVRESKDSEMSSEEDVYDGRTVVIKDSDTGEVVSDATVTINDDISLMTDDKGKVTLPEEIEDGEYTVSVNKGDDYVETDVTMTVSDNEISTTPQISIPKTVDYERFKIVLDWSKNSIDLDAHIRCGWQHVYYANRKSKNINLDHDERKGNGVETMTIEKADPSDEYQYFVYDYTNEGKWKSNALSFSKAHVSVYKDNTFIKEFTITPDQIGVKWHVFTIKNGEDIEFVNKISN